MVCVWGGVSSRSSTGGGGDTAPLQGLVLAHREYHSEFKAADCAAVTANHAGCCKCLSCAARKQVQWHKKQQAEPSTGHKPTLSQSDGARASTALAQYIGKPACTHLGGNTSQASTGVETRARTLLMVNPGLVGSCP